MLKQVSAAMLCLLVLASCAPTKPEVKIDGTSKEAYEKSLVLMASGLTSSEKEALSLAIEILQETYTGLSQLSPDANKRSNVTGKSHSELLDNAKAYVLEWFDQQISNEKLYYQLRGELTGKVDLKILKFQEKQSKETVQTKVGSDVIVFHSSDATIRISNRSKYLISNPAFTDENNLYVFSNPRIRDIKPNDSIVVKVNVNRDLSDTSLVLRSVKVEGLEIYFDFRELVNGRYDDDRADFYAVPYGPRKYNAFLKLIGHKRQIPG